MPEDPQEREPQAQPRAAEAADEGAQATLNRARDAIARAQRLVDTRPESEFALAWCIEAIAVGDLPAVAALLLSREVRLERLHSAMSALPPETPVTVTLTVEPADPQSSPQ